MTGGLELGGVYGATIERIKVQGWDKPRLWDDSVDVDQSCGMAIASG